MLPLPRHIAIIMDGNGRWAKSQGKPRVFGHKHGAETLRAITKACQDLGIQYLSVYAFSTENWKRSSDEVGFLMNLLQETIQKELMAYTADNPVRIKFVGSMAELPPSLQASIRKAESASEKGTGLQLNIMINYGSRQEMVSAVNAIIASGAYSEINEEIFSQHLYTSGIPDPDLMIRTSGEMRLSNFLLWQSAYTELWITKKHWPDFKKEDLMTAIEDYQKRDRRFGVEA